MDFKDTSTITFDKDDNGFSINQNDFNTIQHILSDYEKLLDIYAKHEKERICRANNAKKYHERKKLEKNNQK